MWLWFASLALALQVQMTPKERFERATVVLVGEVTSSEVLWEPSALGGMETHVWVAPERALRGALPAVLQINYPGGELGGVRVEVDDTPSFVQDRRYLLFLVADGRGGWSVLGGPDGALRLDTPGQSPGPTLEQTLARLGIASGAP